MTAAATLSAIERLGPQRLTVLAAREGVSQPAMTQLISRLEESGLVRREASPEDGRVVLVVITDEGRAVLARRRSVRSERMAAIIAQLDPEHRAALAIALPALDALASVPRDDDPARAAAR
jgi:DNA-binding MarR family transcriptional regulator